MNPGIVASEIDGHLQPQPPTTTSGIVTTQGTASGSNSTVAVYFTPNPLGVPATSYVISGIGTGTAVASGTSSPISISYPFNANTNYSFATQGINSFGAGNFGNIIGGVEPFPATPTPSGLYATIDDTEDVAVTFDYIANATSYIVTASGYAAGQQVFQQTFPGPGTSPTVSFVLNNPYALGVSYDFSAQSQNFAGTSAQSSISTLTPNPFGPPLAPVFTAVPNGSNSQITVTITPDTNPLDNLPTGYSVTDLTGGFGSTSGDGPTFVLNGGGSLQPVSEIQVVANGTYGSASSTQTLNFYPGPVTPVGTPIINSPTSVTVNYTPNTAAQYTESTSFACNAIGTDSSYFSGYSTSNSITVSGAFNTDITYTFYVVASDEDYHTSEGVEIGTAEPNIVKAFTATIEAVGGGGGGSWYGGGGGGGYASASITVTPGSTVVSTTGGTGGAGTGTWNVAGNAGTGMIVSSNTGGSATGPGGFGGGIANNSTGSTNKGNGGASGGSGAGGGGNNQAGGGGGGAGGNGTAASGALGGNGGVGVAPVHPTSSNPADSHVGTGGGGRSGGAQGNGYSGPGAGGYSETAGNSGIAIISWLTSSFTGTFTLTGGASSSTTGTYTLVYVNGGTGSVTFNV
jgi:hypothetical protein